MHAIGADAVEGVSKSYLPGAGAAAASLLAATFAAKGASAKTPARAKNDLRS